MILKKWIVHFNQNTIMWFISIQTLLLQIFLIFQKQTKFKAAGEMERAQAMCLNPTIFLEVSI